MQMNSSIILNLFITLYLIRPILSNSALISTIPIQELDITLGRETQVSVNPEIQITSTIAGSRFTPKDRGCYFEVINNKIA